MKYLGVPLNIESCKLLEKIKSDVVSHVIWHWLLR